MLTGLPTVLCVARSMLLHADGKLPLVPPFSLRPAGEGGSRDSKQIRHFVSTLAPSASPRAEGPGISVDEWMGVWLACPL